MSSPPPERKPAPLDYQSTDDKRRRGETILIRAVGCVLFVLFPLWGWHEWSVIDRGHLRLVTLLQPSLLLCVVGAGVCLMVALGWVRR